MKNNRDEFGEYSFDSYDFVLSVRNIDANIIPRICSRLRLLRAQLKKENAFRDIKIHKTVLHSRYRYFVENLEFNFKSLRCTSLRMTLIVKNYDRLESPSNRDFYQIFKERRFKLLGIVLRLH